MMRLNKHLQAGEGRTLCLPLLWLAMTCILFASTPSLCQAYYNVQAAVDYSNRWCGSARNPAYHDYSYEGGDCANYVSQCLIAGGFLTQTYPAVYNLVAAIEARGGYLISAAELRAGDVLVTRLDSGGQHVVFVCSGQGTGCRINGHTSNVCSGAAYGFARCYRIPGGDNAQYISGLETIPGTMQKGKSYNVSITMHNNGSTTWTQAGGYKLGGVDGTHTHLFAPVRVELGAGDSIAPGQSKTFNFTMTANVDPFTYWLVWRMVREGVNWFGDQPGKTITVVHFNDAAYVSNTIPSSMQTGKSYSVSVTMKNLGSTTWTRAAEYKLGAVGDSDPFGTTRVLLDSSDSIGPEQSKRFTWTMTAPSSPGTYTTDWRMMREGVEWFGSTHSESVTVTLSPPTITGHPSHQSKCAGESATFSVSATGQSLSYRWQKDGSDLSNGGHYSGVTTTTITVSNVDGSVAGNYRCKVSNTGGTVYSSAASLSLKAATAITSHPGNRRPCAGETATFSVAASGAGTVSYRWQKDRSNLSNGGHYSGVTTATLTVSNASAADEAEYRCVVTADCGSATSNAASLSLKAATEISQHPSDADRCPGENATFEMLATGEGTLSYRWHKDGIALDDGDGLSGAATPSLQITSLINSDAGSYSCTVTGGCGPTSSSPASLVVHETTSLVESPSGRIVCPGDAVSFSVSAHGAELSYQWQKDEADLADGPRMSGTTSSALQMTGVLYEDSGSYRCVVRGRCGVLVSPPGALTVKAGTTITYQPESHDARVGDLVQFGIGASGAGLSYQWQKEGDNLSDGGRIFGSRSQLLRISGVTAADAGYYWCVVSGDCGEVISSVAELSLGTPRHRRGAMDVNSGGLRLSSANYVLTGSTSQAGGIGGVSGTGVAAMLGFWQAALARPTVIVPPDLDRDGDVDADDFAIFAACVIGPAIPYEPGSLPPGCFLVPDGDGIIAADFDRDGDVDQSDFGVLQRCSNGRGIPSDPHCAE